MESSEETKSLNQKECVTVAVNIRPLITSELLMGCTDCVTVVPGEPQVQIGAHAFTYDHVYGNSGCPSTAIFEECVAPLVDAFFHGYNATVLAYGQTGSGKTYTMGTNYNAEDNSGGIIDQVMSTIFKKIETQKANTEFLIRVSFIEIFKEEVFDLLDPHPTASLRGEGASHAKPAVPCRVPIQIRETTNGGITLAGVIEAEVRSKEEMASYLFRGSLARATGSTNMNSQSSRSHAIFTICLEQKNTITYHGKKDEIGDDMLFSKLHLVDLAGSERAKRTGADGLRFKEGVHINRGLLALGNVISALGDEKKRKEGGHVPYRDSKLTRLLQDSLGGNSKTVMIACISPADSNAEETINTLKYANRARNIQNKAVINRDPVAAEMQRLHNQLEQLQTELLFSRDGGASLEELQLLRHKVSLLEASNIEFRQELKDRQITCDHLAQRAIDAQVEKDKLILTIKSARNGKPWDEIGDTENMQECDLMKNYISKIQELEAEVLRVQNSAIPRRGGYLDYLDLNKDRFQSRLDELEFDSHSNAADESIEAEEDEKEQEQSSLQDKLDKELQELDKRLELKEAEMNRFSKVDASVMKQHYERKLDELEQEKKSLQKDIAELHQKLSNISSASDGGAQKLKEDYLQKLNMLEAQVSELKRKQEAQSQLLRQKQKSEDASKRLQEEIQRIKSQKVQLQQKIKQESEQFSSWKATREKEVMQLKKEGRRNEYEMHKLLALNQRQKMVLQRKAEEASLATKRLKELLEAKKASSREMFGSGNANGPGIQALMQTIEHELEVTLRVHEVRSEYERQLQERAAMAKEIAKLKEESEIFKQQIMRACPQTMSPSARNSRIVALENMLATSSSSLVFMASQLSEAEERERVFSGRGRWNQVRSLAEAKNLMNYLFNLASSSRCQLRDKELNCREKYSIISELKETVVKLHGSLRQLEAKLAERDLELQKFASRESIKDVGCSTKISRAAHDGYSAALHKAPRTSQLFSLGGNDSEMLDDMDTSDSDPYEVVDDEDDEDWVKSGQKHAKRMSKSLASVEVCCSCSKYSSCKTKKCECRNAGSICSVSCGCVSSKCANRKADFIKKVAGGTTPIGLSSEGGSNSSFGSSAEDVKNMEHVSQGTMLLQNSLSERPTLLHQDPDDKVDHPRKALSDIGNTMDNPNVPKPPRRKNWRKSSIQLVPSAEPPLAASAQQNEAPRNLENVPLRLPRAMDRADLEHNPPFVDRNSVRSDEPVSSSKDNEGISPPKPPVRLRKAADEKESHMA